MKKKIISKPPSGFTMIQNDTLREPTLSWQAKGLLAYLLSHADGYRIYKTELHKAAKNGKDGTASAFSELEAAGYITREQISAGRFNYSVSENPQRKIRNGKSATENPTLRNNNIKFKNFIKEEQKKEEARAFDEAADFSPISAGYLKPYELTLASFNWPPQISKNLKDVIIKYFDYMTERKPRFGGVQTVNENIKKVVEFLRQGHAAELVAASIKEAIERGNVTFNPVWTKARQDEAAAAKIKAADKRDGFKKAAAQLENNPDFFNLQ